MIINLYWAIKLLMYKIVHVAQLAQLRWSSAHKYSLSHCMWFYSTLNIYWYFNYKHALSRLVMQWQLFRERLISQLLDLTWEVITWHKYILQLMILFIGLSHRSQNGYHRFLDVPAGKTWSGSDIYISLFATSNHSWKLYFFFIPGTSTDVSRFAGQFEHVFETTTAGITIQAPQVRMKAIVNNVISTGPLNMGMGCHHTPSPNRCWLIFVHNGFLATFIEKGKVAWINLIV